MDKKSGIQDGVVQPDGSIHYLLNVQVIRHPDTDLARFRSPYVHGSPNQFLYLGWRGTGEAPHKPWLKRLRVPLGAITWQQVKGLARSGATLQGVVDASGSTAVRLLDNGWAPV